MDAEIWLVGKLNFQFAQKELWKGMFFTEMQSAGITNSGQLLENVEPSDGKESRHGLVSLLLSFFLIRHLRICGMTPPLMIVALVREPISSSSWIVICKWCRVKHITFRSFDVCPASPGTSAVRLSKMAVLHTVAVAPAYPWLVILDFRYWWMLPMGHCKPALYEQVAVDVLAFPESLPAIPPAVSNSARGWTSKAEKRARLQLPTLLLVESIIWTAKILSLKLQNLELLISILRGSHILWPQIYLRK